MTSDQVTAERLVAQGNKMRAKASKASAAQQMLRRAEQMMSGLDDVRQLAVTTDRPSVEVHCVGETFPVPDTVGLSLYRVAQEALSNVRRHSAATSARVTLRHLSEPGERAAVEVEVLDDGPTRSTPARTAAGSGSTASASASPCTAASPTSATFDSDRRMSNAIAS